MYVWYLMAGSECRVRMYIPGSGIVSIWAGKQAPMMFLIRLETAAEYSGTRCGESGRPEQKWQGEGCSCCRRA